MNLSPYLLNVALHAAVLSAASVLIIAFLRKPRAKAAAALGCLMGIGTLSWLSPLRPAEKPALSIPITTPRLVEVAQAAPPPLIETSALPVTGQVASPSTASRMNFQTVELVAMLWATGVLVGLLKIARPLWQGRRWQGSLARPDDNEWAMLRNALPREMDRNAFRVAEETVSPCVTGFLKPRVVIPRSLLGGSKPSGLAWALRHELTHFDGQDSRWAVAVGGIRMILWWNPLVHWIGRTWSEAREKTCDQAAATTDAERADYGEFLVAMAAALSTRPACGPAMARHGKAKRLKQRIASLLAAAPGMPAGVSRHQAWGCGIVFVAALGATSLLAFEKEAPEAGAEDGKLTLEMILNPPPQLGVSMALLKTAEPFCTQGQVFSSEALDLKLQTASRGRAIQLMPLPWKVEEIGPASWAHLTSSAHNEPDTTSGAGLLNALLDHPRSDVPATTNPPWDGKTAATPFLGWVVGRNSRLAGENVEVSIRAAYSFTRGNHLAPGFGMTGLLSRESLRLVNFEAKAEVPSGKAVGFTFGEVEPGVHVTVILGLTVGKPWELPATWGPGPFPFSSLSPKPQKSRPVSFTPVPVDEDDLEYHRTLKLSRDAHKVWLEAVDALPENHELVRLRERLAQQLREKPDDHREINWKLQRLGEAILANARKNLNIRILEEESSKLMLANYGVMSKMNAETIEQRQRQADDRERQEMEMFERRRHHW